MKYQRAHNRYMAAIDSGAERAAKRLSEHQHARLLDGGGKPVMSSKDPSKPVCAWCGEPFARTELCLNNGQRIAIADIGFMEAALAECKAHGMGGDVRRGGEVIAACHQTPGGGWIINQTGRGA